MPRRRRKEHEAHHVGAGLQRGVERLARGQAANFDEQGHGFAGQSPPGGMTGSDGAAFYNVAPCLSRPRGAHETPPCSSAGSRCGSRRARPPLARRSASCARARSRSASCWRAARRQWRWPEPGRHAAADHAQDRHCDDHDEQRQRHRDRRDRCELNGIERHRHEMPVGDREDDEDQSQRDQDQSREELAHDHLSRAGDRRAIGPATRRHG